MEIPKFGTRLKTPQPPIQQVYDETLGDDKVDQQNEYDYKNDGSVDQNFDQNENNDQNLNPIDKPLENPIDGQNPNPQQYDKIENDQYYAYYDDHTEDVESKDSSKDVIFTQTTAHKSDQNFNINSNKSLPIEITHKVLNVVNWHKYESGGQPLNQ